MISCPCPAVVVRYLGGASGRFIALLLNGFCYPLNPLNDPVYAHKNREWLHLHNFQDIISIQAFAKFAEYTNPRLSDYTNNFTEYQTWFESRFQINYQEEPKIISIASHSLDPSIITESIENCKVINITFTDNDFDQIVFNSVYKNIAKDRTKFALDKLTTLFQKFYPAKYTLITDKFGSITFDTVDSNLQLICAMEKLIVGWYSQQFAKLVPFAAAPEYNLPFHTIANQQIIGLLEEMSEFVGIQLTDDRRANCIELINQYANAQISIPWKIDINELL